jgi:GAF domain-containing protein
MPQGLMAVPLLYDERALGVLEVLDRPQNSSFSLSELELLALFANQAAIALDLLQRARRARAALDGEGELAAVSRLAAAAERAPREVGLPALEALADLLERAAGTE